MRHIVVPFLVFALSPLACGGSVNVSGDTSGGGGSGSNVHEQAALPSLTLGAIHSCAATTSGAAYCWGANDMGQLGDGSTDDALSPTPVMIASIAWLSAGSDFTCALDATGSTSCWGSDDGLPTVGALDQHDVCDSTGPEQGFACDLAPKPVASMPSVTELAGGAAHGCARTSDGHVYCWGEDNYGQLGLGAPDQNAYVTTPTLVGQLDDVAQIATGAMWSCALGNDGSVQCWGDNQSGQLCTGTPSFYEPITTLAGLSQVTQLSLADNHACAVLAGGTVSCWGANDSGQLGDGTTAARTAPVQVLGVSGALAVAVGESHSCALLSNGTVQCWGDNQHGQLGDGTTNGPDCIPMQGPPPGGPGPGGDPMGGGTCRPSASAVSGLAGAVQIAAGTDHTCARLADQSLVCWGANYRGQLGDGTTTDRSLPTGVQL